MIKGIFSTKGTKSTKKHSVPSVEKNLRILLKESI